MVNCPVCDWVMVEFDMILGSSEIVVKRWSCGACHEVFSLVAESYLQKMRLR